MCWSEYLERIGTCRWTEFKLEKSSKVAKTAQMNVVDFPINSSVSVGYPKTSHDLMHIKRSITTSKGLSWHQVSKAISIYHNIYKKYILQNICAVLQNFSFYIYKFYKSIFITVKSLSLHAVHHNPRLDTVSGASPYINIKYNIYNVNASSTIDIHCDEVNPSLLVRYYTSMQQQLCTHR